MLVFLFCLGGGRGRGGVGEFVFFSWNTTHYSIFPHYAVYCFSMTSGLQQIQTVFFFLRESTRRVRMSGFQQELTLPLEERQFCLQEEVPASTSRQGPQSQSTSMVLFLPSYPFEHTEQLDRFKSIPARKSVLSLKQHYSEFSSKPVVFVQKSAIFLLSNDLQLRNSQVYLQCLLVVRIVKFYFFLWIFSAAA